MLPQYAQEAEGSKRLGPLLEARRRSSASSTSNPVGLILLTAACSLVLLVQVRDEREAAPRAAADVRESRRA